MRKIIALTLATGALMLAACTASARAQTRSRDFDANWKFALVNPTDITDPTGAYATARSPPRARRPAPPMPSSSVTSTTRRAGWRR